MEGLENRCLSWNAYFLFGTLYWFRIGLRIVGQREMSQGVGSGIKFCEHKRPTRTNKVTKGGNIMLLISRA